MQIRDSFNLFLRRWVFSVVGAAVLIIGGVVFLAGYLLVSAPGLCGSAVSRQIISPNGKLKAIIFERDCGATTDFSTQISILKANKDLGDEAGNVFIADSNHQQLPVSGVGVLDVKATWLSDHALQVAYPPGARIFRKASQVSGVTISYLPED